MSSILQSLLTLYVINLADIVGIPSTKGTGDISFRVQSIPFIYTDSLYQVKFFIEIDIEDTKGGSFEVALNIFSKNISVKDSWKIPFYKYFLGKIIDAFTVYLKPDTYQVSITLRTILDNKSGYISILLPLPWVGENSLFMTHPIYLTSVKEDTLVTQFHHRGYFIQPNLSSLYEFPQDTLIFFFELFVQQKDTGNLIINEVVIRSRDQKPVLRKPPKIIKREKRNQFFLLDFIPLIGLPSDTYELFVEVIEPTLNQKLLSKSPFSYKRFTLNLDELIPDTLLDIISFINYFATPQEINEFKGLQTKDSRKMYLYRFWRKFDINPQTEENEFVKEFIERVIEADKKFRHGKNLGRYTERGRIYIKYGPPDEIEKHVQTATNRDYEIWYYYRRGELRFIFMDLEMNGNFRLIFSSIPDEPTRPDWKGLIETEIMEFE